MCSGAGAATRFREIHRLLEGQNEFLNMAGPGESLRLRRACFSHWLLSDSFFLSGLEGMR
jgi:hypothetical protein